MAIKPQRKGKTPVRTVIPRVGGQRFVKFGDVAKPIRPTTDTPLRTKTFEPKDPIVVYRRGLRTSQSKEEALEARAVPIEQVYGSLEERIMYKALTKRQIPFDFQSSFQGGRRELGGLVADFVLLDRPMIINPLGTIWHAGMANRARDVVQADLLRLMGYVYEELWDWEVREERIFDEWMRTHIDVPLVQPRINEHTIRLGFAQ